MTPDAVLRRRLMIATICAEAVVIPTCAWTGLRLSGGDLAISAPILAVSALEACRIPLSSYATRLKPLAKLTAILALAGIGLLTGEVISAGFSSVISGRLAPITEATAERDATRELLSGRKAEVERLTAEVAEARASLTGLAGHPPALAAVQSQTCRTRKGASYDCTPPAALRANAAAQASFDSRLQQAQAALRAAEDRLRASPGLQTAEEAVRASEARLRAATAANPMAQLARGLSDQTLDRVRSIVSLSLGLAVAGATSLLAWLAHLEPRSYRREGGAFNRAIRSYLARRKRLRVIERPIFKTKTIFKYVPVDPGTGRPFGVVKGGKP